MTAQGLLVYGTTGNMLVAPPALVGRGAPVRPGILGQNYYDTSVSPRVGYVWDGQIWATDSSSIGSFTTLTVSGQSTLSTTTVNGNMTWPTATQGPVLTDVSASGASPQAVNARGFRVTFTGVSIAAGATQSFTIQNSVITGASTDVQLTMYGATAGAALTIQSITNSAGQSVVIVQNGTGATTTTANITFIGQILN